jgi:Muconolactone delta-isomerase
VEFLTTFTVIIPDGADDEVVDDLTTREAQRAFRLAQQGKLVRLWALPAEPGTSRALGAVASRKPVRAADDPDIAAYRLSADPVNDVLPSIARRAASGRLWQDRPRFGHAHLAARPLGTRRLGWARRPGRGQRAGRPHRPDLVSEPGWHAQGLRHGSCRRRADSAS